MSLVVNSLTRWATVSLAMAIVWFVRRKARRAAWVDVAWTIGTGSLAMAFALAAGGAAARQALIAALAPLSSLRLTWYLVAGLQNSAEDGRYVRLPCRYADSADSWLFGVFQAQALLYAIFAAPAHIAARIPSRVGWSRAVGALIWAVAVAGETVADHQLRRLRDSGPESLMVCRFGLWKCSRHPNYSLEWLHWWSYVAVAWQAAYGWLTLVGPGATLLHIFRVMGAPPTVEQAIAGRGDAYQGYQREVSPFFSWWPREDSR